MEPHDSSQKGRPRAWRFQFSIRSLLLFTSVVAVALCTWLVPAHKEQALRQLREQVSNARGTPNKLVDEAIQRVQSLGVGKRAAVDLVPLLKWGSNESREQTIYVLKKLGSEAIPAMVDSLEIGNADPICGVLADLGADAVSPVLDVWKRELDRVDRKLCPDRECIVQPGSDEAGFHWRQLQHRFTDLIRTLLQREQSAAHVRAAVAEYPDARVRLQLICALHRVQALVKVKWSGWNVRIHLDDAAWSDILVARLSSDSDALVRAAAAQALGQLKSPGSSAALTAALSDDDPYVRLFAAEGLLAVDNSQAGAIVAALVRDPESLDPHQQVRAIKIVAALAPEALQKTGGPPRAK